MNDKSEGYNSNIPTRESRSNKSYEEIINDSIAVVPKDYIENVRNFTNLVLQRKNIHLDHIGNIILLDSGKKISLKDFFRGLFVRNAKIKHITDFLREILFEIEDILIKQGSKFIRNEKVFDLLTEKEQAI